MQNEIKIPTEYEIWDYGFSGVDSPNQEVPPPPPPVVSAETEDKIEAILDKVNLILNTMYRIEETNNEDDSEAELRDKVRQLEAIIVPLLNNLLKSADKDYIYWPNRRDLIEAQLKKVLSITRG